MVLASAPSGVKLDAKQSSVRKCIVAFWLQERPMSISCHESASALVAFFKSNCVDNLASWLTEGTYTHRVARHPTYMENAGSGCASATVFPSVYHLPRLIQPSERSKPELSMRCSTPCRPPLSFEWKSFPSEGIEELSQTTVAQLEYSYFRASNWIFYAHPPWGLSSLASASALAIVFVAEMVGVLHFSVYAGACSVGDAVYNQHIAMLESQVASVPAIDLEAADLKRCPIVGARVQWTASPVNGCFFKVLRYDLYPEDPTSSRPLARSHYWRKLFSVYQAYQQLAVGEMNILSRAIGLPPALVPARMLYGEFQVAVQMPFLSETEHVSHLDILKPEQVQLVASALVFLLQHELLYTDLRAPNILTRGDEVFLIDYDDMQSLCGSEESLLDHARRAHAECLEGANIWAQVVVLLTPRAE